MTTKGTDNRFRSLTVVGEAGTPSTPGAGDFKLYVADDGTFFLMDDTGATVDLTASGFSDPMTSRGDIIVRNASNVTARLAKGSADTFLHSDGTDVGYAAVTDAMLSTSDITTNNASTSKHGFLKKLDNNAAHFMDGTGAWSTPSVGTPTFVGAKAYNSATQTMNGSGTNSGNTTLTFDSEEYDTSTIHSTSSNTGRLTAPSTGYYQVGIFAYGTPLSAGTFIDPYINGSLTTKRIGRLSWHTVGTFAVSANWVLNLTAADYVEFVLNNPNASTFTVGHASAQVVQTAAWMTLLGA